MWNNKSSGPKPEFFMTDPANLQIALVSALVLGLHHGFDYDHIAAITDITSVQSDRKQGMRLGLLYALGHAATVAILGSVVILFQVALPHGLDRVAERLVGITLLLLGLYVLGSVIRGIPAPRTRFHLLAAAAHWLQWKFRSYGNPGTARPDPPAWNYSPRSVLTVGVIHGLGAETPSQLMILVLTAHLGGTGKGFLCLGIFLAGLLLMNTAMTASAVGLFGLGLHRPRFQLVVTALTAIYSLIVGAFFLLGSSGLLPALT